MFSVLLNPLPILLTITTSFGVLLHDTQIDKATKTALALPATIAAFGAADVAFKANDPHTHTERFSVSGELQTLKSAQPRVQARDDNKKYISVKKYVSDGMGSQYHWPSV